MAKKETKKSVEITVDENDNVVGVRETITLVNAGDVNEIEVPSGITVHPMQYVGIDSISSNEKNPRFIKDKEFNELVKSIKVFPEMLEARPCVVDEQGIILGGNMRHRAAVAAGLQVIPVVRMEGMTEEKKREFIIKDNVNKGEWDMDILANEWEQYELIDFGINQAMFPVDTAPKFEFDEGDEHGSGEGIPMPNSDIKMLQLFFTEQQHQSFIEMSEVLKDKYGLKTITDSALKAMEYAHAKITEENN